MTHSVAILPRQTVNYEQSLMYDHFLQTHLTGMFMVLLYKESSTLVSLSGSQGVLHSAR